MAWDGNPLMDAFQGSRAQARALQAKGYGIAVILPAIPLWVPDDAKKELTRLVMNMLRLWLQRTAGRLSDASPVGVTGNLAQSWSADPATDMGGVEIIGVDLDAGITGRISSSLPYAIVMDQGRRPGAPISREGIDAIGYWAQRKLGMSADEANSAKWAIAQVIVAQGIEGKLFVDAVMGQSAPEAERMFADLADDMAAAMAQLQRPGGN